jgi:hypothetical protein
MAKTRNTIQKKNLAEYDVLIDDTLATSEYFQVTNLPPSFGGGRNSFLLAGSPYLAPTSIIQIEILDADANPIYQNPVQRYVEGESRLISVEINENTKPGFATIIILGQAQIFADGQPIPPDWQSTYNVRWVSKVLVEPRKKNISPIILENSPSVFVEEQRRFAVETSSFSVDSTVFTASLSPLLYSSVQIGYLIKAEAPTTFAPSYLGGYITGSLTVDGARANIYVPITEILNSSTAFSTGHLINTERGELVDTLYLYSGSYTTTRNGVPSAVVANVSLIYTELNTVNIQNPISYGKMRVVNLNTVSGEIKTLRISSKVSTNLSDYVAVANVPMVTTELLVSESIRGDIPVGDFLLAPTASSNWYANTLEYTPSNIIYPISGSAEYYNIPAEQSAFPTEVTDDVLLRSVRAVVPIGTSAFEGTVAQSGYFIAARSPITIFASSEYTLQLDAIYSSRSGSTNLVGNIPQVDIYVVGVAGTQIIDNNPLGQKIGTLLVNPNAQIQRYEAVQFNFEPQLAAQGSVGLRFVISNGFWYFSNISLKPASDEIFSPDEVTVIVPNTQFTNDYLQYKVEFLDVNNNSTTTTAISTPAYFTGSYIDLGVIKL